MAGIYVHIPFCKTRCVYCDFYTRTDESKTDAFVQALCSEVRLRKHELTEPVKTVYFGGGTPTRLSQEHFNDIFAAIFNEYAVLEDAEITIEANPDDLSPEYIRQLATLPFNRISIGIQSFNDEELTFLSRRHTAQQAVDAVKNCQHAGFHNISIDLMYGLPKQTMHIWEENLRRACALNIQHISAYHLIYEEKTKLYSLLKKGTVQPVSDELSTQMFSTLIDALSEDGFAHYEISNFAKDKLYSKHNTAYWQNEKYVGLGPSAHSYDGESRRWNVASTGKYIDAVLAGKLLQEIEQLTPAQHYNEFILTGLRTMWGVNLSVLKEKFGTHLCDYCLRNAQKYIANGLLTLKNNTLTLTREGIFISDGIMSELMWVRKD